MKLTSKVSQMLAMTSMIAAAGLYGSYGGTSSAAVRNDPNREKTENDLKHIAAAQRKRERKHSKRKLI
jgi:hypothetical protein